jgi:DNA-binding NarL/FixJ family response regulator
VDIYKKDHQIDKNKFRELTNREIEVLYYLSNGYTNNEIALELFITEKTVKNYVTSIYSKLNLSNRVKAALYAIENHIEKHLP